jgi:hypothetical protein
MFIPTLNPQITIHLGDVYYAGTSGEETRNLLNVWPQGSFGSFALKFQSRDVFRWWALLQRGRWRVHF